MAFIKGLHINEETLLAHELIRDFSNKMGSRAYIKIDLRKAFDKVNQEFLLEILRVMKFPDI